MSVRTPKRKRENKDESDLNTAFCESPQAAPSTPNTPKSRSNRKYTPVFTLQIITEAEKPLIAKFQRSLKWMSHAFGIEERIRTKLVR